MPRTSLPSIRTTVATFFRASSASSFWTASPKATTARCSMSLIFGLPGTTLSLKTRGFAIFFFGTAPHYTSPIRELPVRFVDGLRARDALELELAERAHPVAGGARELFAHQEPLAELAGEPFDARRQVHRRADAREVEPADAADVAVGDVAEVQPHAEAE